MTITPMGEVERTGQPAWFIFCVGQSWHHDTTPDVDAPKTLLLGALIVAAASPAFAEAPPQPLRLEGACNGRVVVEAVRPKVTAPGGFTCEVMLPNRSQERLGYRVTLVFESFRQLAMPSGSAITIPSQQVTIVVPPGFGSRSSGMLFGTVSRNVHMVYLGAGAGARYDTGPLMSGGPAGLRLSNCAPFRS